jgi:hypothetical protein
MPYRHIVIDVLLRVPSLDLELSFHAGMASLRMSLSPCGWPSNGPRHHIDIEPAAEACIVMNMLP